jgi:hypothetical protein
MKRKSRRRSSDAFADLVTADQLWHAIKGRGAFRYFKNTLHRLGIQQSWYDYLEEARREFVIEWAKENNMSFEKPLYSYHPSPSGKRIKFVLTCVQPTV